jgi:molybdopterin molybdotransferase
MLVDVEDARARALQVVSVLGGEDVPIARASGRVLADDLASAIDLPRDDVSIMDGYACTLATLHAGHGTLVGESAAGRPWTGTLRDGELVRISTGAVVPSGAALVVAQEDVTRDAERIAIAVPQGHAPGRHIRRAGTDVRRGTVLLRAGTRLSPGELALGAAAGHTHVHVVRRPTVAILATGDELVGIGDAVGAGQLVETNALMLRAACDALGAIVVHEARVPDRPDVLAEALDRAIADADVVLTTGGASVGDHDHVRTAASRPGCEILAWGLALRPGKPTGVIRTERGIWLALAGNPASTFVGWHLLAAPILRTFAGVRGEVMRPLVRMQTTAPLVSERARVHWIRATHRDGNVSPLVDQLSGNLRSLALASAMIRVPAGATIDAGDPCDVLVLDDTVHERPS